MTVGAGVAISPSAVTGMVGVFVGAVVGTGSDCASTIATVKNRVTTMNTIPLIQRLDSIRRADFVACSEGLGCGDGDIERCSDTF